ncbi:hypothetical protein PMIN01_03921 [Paraphaeosphaeria minitans]|uniref:Uncharacterized protein n=1 Tax=Paraphaeosphaeria minitans TaxID=565426 RepID=A0A9P6KTA6_9PLEO|nr:hypothetical protein PMIN01_03921 [Paraphaeosphaeria minitans]
MLARTETYVAFIPLPCRHLERAGTCRDCKETQPHTAHRPPPTARCMRARACFPHRLDGKWRGWELSRFRELYDGKVGRESFTQTGCAEQDGKSVTPHHTHQSPPDTVPTVGTVPSDSKPQLQLLPTYLPTYLRYQKPPRISHPKDCAPVLESPRHTQRGANYHHDGNLASPNPPTYLPTVPTHPPLSTSRRRHHSAPPVITHGVIPPHLITDSPPFAALLLTRAVPH